MIEVIAAIIVGVIFLYFAWGFTHPEHKQKKTH